MVTTQRSSRRWPQREERRADLHARREWRRDRRDRAARAGRGQDRAHPSCADAPGYGGGRGQCIAPSQWRRWRARRCTSYTLSSEEALNQVREARDRGLPAFAETCPQYLLLSVEELRGRTSKARSTCSRRLSGRSAIRPNCGMGSRTIICRWSRPIIAHSASRPESLGKDDFTKIPNGGQASRTGCSFSTTME